jgi:excinuclease ABC subunit A
MKEDKIIIKGARVHNLKSVDLELPKNKIIAFTGVSGSGKSSLAFDTIFAEGQRRYIESLSPYARQFLGQMDKPDVDMISGLSPAISISQKALSHNPRSTVATLTEIYDYLRVLFARVGKPHCPVCGEEIKRLTIDEMFNLVTEKAREMNAEHLTIFSPVVRGRKGEYYQLLYDFLNKGFSEARVDGKFHSLHGRVELSRYKAHDIDIVIDKVMPSDESRLFEALETAISFSKGLVVISFHSEKTATQKKGTQKKLKNPVNSNELLLSSRLSCPNDGFSFSEIEPRLFSFNSPHGACEACFGLGKEGLFSDKICPVCQGKRLKPEALSVKIYGRNINDIVSLTIEDCYEFFITLEEKLTEKEKILSRGLSKEIISRLGFLLEVGLDYITLEREAGTLSGGEAQRIRLSSQIGSMLSNTLYVLDEPTIGLHERDTAKLAKTLKNLRDLNNTIIIVEHEDRMMRESDYLVDLGPGAGVHGGKIVASGETQKLLKDKKQRSLTLDYLRGDKKIAIPERRTKTTPQLKIIGAKLNNLKNVDAAIPLQKLTCITGVSGSGKSSLFEVLHKNTVRKLYHINEPIQDASKILGTEYIRRIVEIGQSPIGRTPRSNPATYTGIWTPIRDFFASLEDSRARGYTKSRFSFNVKNGRCEACQGAGFNLIEMHFLPPVLVQCDVCKGKRFNRETLEVKHEGKNIADILDMTVTEALEFFKDIYLVSEKLKVLEEIGLGYIKLGQSATTLSGGEAQRIKLAKELSEHATKTVYLLDEPTVGLHYHDVELLLEVLQKLIERQNTIIVIEHNLELIKTCDYIIDLGPEGGDKGGKIITQGTPEEVARNKNSHTGHYLKKLLS